MILGTFLTAVQAASALIWARLEHLGWRRLYEQVISEILAQKHVEKDSHFGVAPQAS